MATKNLHEIPKFQDRWSNLYLERGKLDVSAGSLSFSQVDGRLPLPIDQIAIIMLGPGCSVTHAAMKILAENNCLLSFCGEDSTRLYAHGTGGTHSSHRLLHQARLYANKKQRLAVARRMYQKRFPEILSEDTPIAVLRGKEGYRVREAYEENAKIWSVPWNGRNYDYKRWGDGDPVNRALSIAASCLYGVCHAAILSSGYSPAIGFIHTGKMLSFVYDIADLYRTDIIFPIAFEAAQKTSEIESRVRQLCREVFREHKLMQKILPDIAEVLDASDDIKERPNELEGAPISMANRADQRRVSG